MLGFAIGVITGGIIFAVIAFGPILSRLNHQTDNITANVERLINARKRFGQIANRESIGEARKIANTALKELEL